MGRLLERLMRDSQGAPAATVATVATVAAPEPESVAESQVSQGGEVENTKVQRARLLTLVADDLLPAGLVHSLDDADAAACDGLPDDTLRVYLRYLERGRRMDAGQIPPEWGEPVASFCKGCGPVPLWKGCPPVVMACPWCFRRNAGEAIPRPLVACGDCRHYLPDTVNPPAGIGGCELGHAGQWPMKLHRCKDWRKHHD